MFGTFLLLISSFCAEVVPSPDPTDLSPVAPEVAEILDKWETASRHLQHEAIRFNRTTYDLNAHRIFDSEDRQDCQDWPVEDAPLPMTDDGIPPSPAIFNARGWISATSVFWTLVGEATSRTAIKRSANNPSPDPTDLSFVTPEVTEILDKWEAASRETKTVKLRFVRTVYNLVFQEEKVADGELLFQAPDKVSVVVRPFRKKEKSRRLGKDGLPFTVLADRAETFIWNSNQFLIANDEHKSFERAEIPRKRASNGFNWAIDFSYRNSALPFLFEIRADRIREDYLLMRVRHDDSNIILVAQPRTNALRAHLIECFIMIDSNSWQTSAIKIIDPSGNVETVFKVIDREINPVLPADSFNPDLTSRGYKSVPR